LALVFYTVLSYALAPSSHRFPLYVLLIVTALITLERTVWLSVFLIGSVFWVLRSRSSLRWLVPPVLGLLAVTAVLTYRPFYDRFFYAALPKGESLTLRTLPLNTNGRNATWGAILQRMDKKTLLYGRGIGAADNLFQIQNVLPASQTGVVHNEYLRLLYDGGFLAPTLLLLALACLLLAVLRWPSDPMIRALLAGMVAAYPFAALFDNAIDYYGYVGTGLAILAGISISMRIHSDGEDVPMLRGNADNRAEGALATLPQ
jgi:O-antigen ligase